MSYTTTSNLAETGHAWIPKVPADWQLRRIKYCSPAIVEKTSDSEKHPYVGLENVEPWTGRYIAGTEEKPDAAANRFERGDVLFGKLRPYLAKVLKPDFDGRCTGELLVLRPKLYDSRYLQYLFLSDNFIRNVDASTYGAKMPRAEWGFIGNLKSPLPPRSQQTAIADFLDRETARIDGLIAKEERLLALLEEKRTALISHAVTKGLDPDAELKDSGIPWLGKIPKGWEVVKLGYLCRIGTGSKDTQDAKDDGEYPFFVRSQIPERINSFDYDCEAILTAGDGVGVGKVFHYVQGKFDAHQRVYVLRSFRQIRAILLFYYLREFFKKVALTGDAKSTVDSVRRHMLTTLPVAVPPLDQQDAIIVHIDNACSRLNTLTVKINHAINLLREKRTALISAAVTGKINVKPTRTKTA